MSTPYRTGRYRVSLFFFVSRGENDHVQRPCRAFGPSDRRWRDRQRCRRPEYSWWWSGGSRRSCTSRCCQWESMNRWWRWSSKGWSRLEAGSKRVSPHRNLPAATENVEILTRERARLALRESGGRNDGSNEGNDDGGETHV